MSCFDNFNLFSHVSDENCNNNVAILYQSYSHSGYTSTNGSIVKYLSIFFFMIKIKFPFSGVYGVSFLLLTEGEVSREEPLFDRPHSLLLVVSSSANTLVINPYIFWFIIMQSVIKNKDQIKHKLHSDQAFILLTYKSFAYKVFFIKVCLSNTHLYTINCIYWQAQ